jgi:hypothetical protein
MRILRLVRMTIAAVAIAATLGTPTASADIEIRRDGSKAVEVPAAPPGPTSLDTADGFHLDDAGVGAATMLALVLASAGVVSLRGRRHSSRQMRVS